jgi:iron(II)-dependent oxidoreductase
MGFYSMLYSCGALALGVMAAVALPVAAAAQGAPDMALIPGAVLTMGRDDGLADERPAHRVTVASFRLDRREVTNAQFADFLNAIGGFHNAEGRRVYDADDNDARIHRHEGRWRADAGHANQPVNEATWFGARDYCARRGARLPTEAEWERAARGPEGRRYPWGSAAPDATRARFGAGWMKTLPVGALPAGATPEGVLNLAGNVHEWTSSLYLPYPYSATDGREDRDSEAPRVTRGGAADTDADSLTTTWRGADVSRGPRAGHHNIGFRCAAPAS